MKSSDLIRENPERSEVARYGRAAGICAATLFWGSLFSGHPPSLSGGVRSSCADRRREEENAGYQRVLGFGGPRFARCRAGHRSGSTS
jgi:hypothetical protein